MEHRVTDLAAILRMFEERDHVLAELKTNQEKILAAVDKTNGHINDILAELGGAPDNHYRPRERPTIRERIHRLENDAWAAKLARSALAATWGRVGKFLVIGGTIVAAITGLLRVFGIGA